MPDGIEYATIYEIATGLPLRIVATEPYSPADKCGVGENFVLGEYYGSTYYILNGVATLRPTLSPTVNGLTISGLPIPCSLTTYGNTYEITDGEATLNYDLAGEYLVQVKAFPYLDWEVTVNAN